MSNETFENIQTGDLVLSRICVRGVGFSHGRNFWVKSKVERTTPKQLVVMGKKYHKKNGSLVGGYGAIKLYDASKDQSEEAKNYEKKCQADMAIFKLSQRRLCDHITSEQAEQIISLHDDIFESLDGEAAK